MLLFSKLLDLHDSTLMFAFISVVLLTTLASFRITIDSPSHVAYLPDGFYEVNMLVVPLWGLYGEQFDLAAVTTTYYTDTN